MASPVPQAPKFSYGHPFWQSAVEMRQGNHTLQEVLDRAHEAGYTDLSYHQVGFGLRRAAADLHLPGHASRFLRRRFEAVSADFDSFQAMRDMAQDALREMHDLDEDLLDPEIGATRRQLTEDRRWRLGARAFAWLKECAVIAVKMKEIEQAQDGGPTVSVSVEGPERRVEIESELLSLMERFKQEMPKTAPDALQSLYGPENVRLPGGQIEGGPYVDPEED